LGVFIDLVTHPGNLVFIAAAAQVVGMLCRSQTLLRIFLLIGSSFYFLNYAFAAEEPLWQGMAASTAMSMANVYGLSMLLLSRSTRIIPAHQLELFRMLGGLQPGDFKALMRLGEVRTLQADEVLTVKSKVPDRLFYVIDGTVEIEKDAAPAFRISPRNFIGEVSLILGTPASATVRAPAGTRVVEWPRDRLVREMQRRSRLKLAVEALIARDMARKVAVGSGIVGSEPSRRATLARDEGDTLSGEPARHPHPGEERLAISATN